MNLSRIPRDHLSPKQIASLEPLLGVLAEAHEPSDVVPLTQLDLVWSHPDGCGSESRLSINPEGGILFYRKRFVQAVKVPGDRVGEVYASSYAAIQGHAGWCDPISFEFARVFIRNLYNFPESRCDVAAVQEITT